jgi:hypothetical protein
MSPLDLTQQAPRSPKEELGGLCLLPRMIDVARSKLPGGNIGEYQIGRGLSGVVLKQFGIDVEEFVNCVRDATDDEQIAARFLAERDRAEIRLLAVRLCRATVADVPPEMRAAFEQFYGADVPSDKRVFDLLDENDAQSFGAS